MPDNVLCAAYRRAAGHVPHGRGRGRRHNPRAHIHGQQRVPRGTAEPGQLLGRGRRRAALHLGPDRHGLCGGRPAAHHDRRADLRHGLELHPGAPRARRGDERAVVLHAQPYALFPRRHGVQAGQRQDRDDKPCVHRGLPARRARRRMVGGPCVRVAEGHGHNGAHQGEALHGRAPQRELRHTQHLLGPELQGHSAHSDQHGPRRGRDRGYGHTLQGLADRGHIRRLQRRPDRGVGKLVGRLGAALQRGQGRSLRLFQPQKPRKAPDRVCRL